MRTPRNPKLDEMVRGLSVISSKQGFLGDVGTVLEKDGTWWYVGFASDRGMMREPHRRAQLVIVDQEDTYGLQQFLEGYRPTGAPSTADGPLEGKK